MLRRAETRVRDKRRRRCGLRFDHNSQVTTAAEGGGSSGDDCRAGAQARCGPAVSGTNMTGDA